MSTVAPQALEQPLTYDRFVDNFRVWPDGTTQLVEDGPPYEFMSDDYIIIAAYDDADAVQKCEEMWRWKV